MNTLLRLVRWKSNSVKKEIVEQDLGLFNEIPWNNVDMQLHFDAFTMNKEDAEDLLSVQNFIDDGTFLIRLEIVSEKQKAIIHDGGSQKNLMLSFVYGGKIHHHKIILMQYFSRYSYCLENGGINFPSVAMLIKYHASKMTLPLPCILKEKREKHDVANLIKKSRSIAILPVFSGSPRLSRSGSFRVHRN